MNKNIYKATTDQDMPVLPIKNKFLDYEGVKHLWSKINMNDYPNNQTLIDVINAIDETKANKEDIIPADWNQNDETAKDYIKNRPFYSYPIEPILYDGTFTYETLPNGKIGIYLPDGFSLGEKQHYNITAANFVYHDAYCESNNISWYVNRLNVVITYIEEDGKWAYWYDGGVVGESFYLKIEDVRGNIGYKAIDAEYLPQGLGRSGSGEDSWAFNDKNNIASGYYSIAEGQNTTASGGNSHAEGAGTTASGSSSHAEGGSTTASGTYSHTEGMMTIASKMCSHAEGYNTIAASMNQHVQGQNNIEDNSRTYIHIVGNGKNSNSRSNAHTLDLSGNAWYAGDVYVGSTSGTNKDDGSKKLATEDYVNNKTVQSDWNQTDETALDFIKNKPDVVLKSEVKEIDAIEIAVEMELISPIASENGSIYIDENNAIYSL